MTEYICNICKDTKFLSIPGTQHIGPDGNPDWDITPCVCTKFKPDGKCIACDGTGIDKDSLRYHNPIFPDFCQDCIGCGQIVKLGHFTKIRN